MDDRTRAGIAVAPAPEAKESDVPAEVPEHSASLASVAALAAAAALAACGGEGETGR